MIQINACEPCCLPLHGTALPIPVPIPCPPAQALLDRDRYGAFGAPQRVPAWDTGPDPAPGAAEPCIGHDLGTPSSGKEPRAAPSLPPPLHPHLPH